MRNDEIIAKKNLEELLDKLSVNSFNEDELDLSKLTETQIKILNPFWINSCILDFLKEKNFSILRKLISIEPDDFLSKPVLEMMKKSTWRFIEDLNHYISKSGAKLRSLLQQNREGSSLKFYRSLKTMSSVHTYSRTIYLLLIFLLRCKANNSSLKDSDKYYMKFITSDMKDSVEKLMTALESSVETLESNDVNEEQRAELVEREENKVIPYIITLLSDSLLLKFPSSATNPPSHNPVYAFIIVSQMNSKGGMNPISSFTGPFAHVLFIVKGIIMGYIRNLPHFLKVHRFNNNETSDDDEEMTDDAIMQREANLLDFVSTNSSNNNVVVEVVDLFKNAESSGDTSFPKLLARRDSSGKVLY